MVADKGAVVVVEALDDVRLAGRSRQSYRAEAFGANRLNEVHTLAKRRVKREAQTVDVRVGLVAGQVELVGGRLELGEYVLHAGRVHEPHG